ncbi:hypothetical protein D1AOALGA4SA_6991 [Olavius algarvensis Delta 1 endosymbiont]|nr:hypothetical protein D1AOALGA4SA_6991 [Olavius algarvensis Delta 1 endosymbiont]
MRIFTFMRPLYKVRDGRIRLCFTPEEDLTDYLLQRCSGVRCQQPKSSGWVTVAQEIDFN